MALGYNESTDRQQDLRMKEQSVRGTAEAGAGGVFLPYESHSGIVQENADVQSVTSRSDLRRLLGDFGQGSSPFSFNAELIVGAHDLVDQAVLRAAAPTAAATISNTDYGGVTGVTGQVVTFDSDPIAGGARIGQVFTPISGFDAADIGVNFVIVGGTNSTLTLHKAPQTSGAVGTWTATRQKSFWDGENDCQYTVEQYFAAIDVSSVVEGLRWASFGLTSDQNNTIRRTFGGRGRQKILLDTGSAPGLASPAEPTGLPLSDANKVLIVGGGVLGKISRFDLQATRPDFLPPTGQAIPEDIGLGPLSVTGSVTLLKDSITREQEFIDRLKGFDIGILSEEPNPSGANPFDLRYMSNCRWTSDSPSNAGSDSFSTITLNFEAGVNEDGGAAEKSMMMCSNSAA